MNQNVQLLHQNIASVHHLSLAAHQNFLREGNPFLLASGLAWKLVPSVGGRDNVVYDDPYDDEQGSHRHHPQHHLHLHVLPALLLLHLLGGLPKRFTLQGKH